jgi:hypothetical protein
MMSPFQYIVIIQVPSISQKPGDALQDEAHSNQVSLSTEQVAENNIKVEYVGTKEQVADIFTKPLPWEAFEYLHQRLGVISTPK